MDSAAALQLAIEQIKFARQYTLSLLDAVDEAQWFQAPAGVITHIAWQVGHIAMAQYGLCLFRQRGRKSADLELMPSKFRKQFTRGSIPEVDPANQYSPAELRSALDRIHQQCLNEMAEFPPEQLNEPIDMPYVAHPTKLGALLFSSHHEMIHVGQIGLIRRLLGKQPVR